MSIADQRRIDRVVGSALCAFLSLFCRPRPRPEGRQAPRSILVILLSEMGSLVLAHGMFRTLRERYPGASLYLLTFKRNRQILETLQVVPSENIMAVDGESLCKLAPQSLAALAKLRRRGMDISLDCELFSRVSSILGFLSGASVRAGFHPFTQEGLYRGKLINLPVQYNPYRHISKQFVTLAAALESRQVPPAKRALAEGSVGLPPMNLDRRELASFRRRLCSDFPIIREKRLVLLYPGGGLLPIRAWPLSYFVRVAHELTGRGYAVGVIGTREDRPLAEEIAGACANDACVNLTGYTQTVRELMLLFHLAALLITNDGGPGHFASLTPIPAILLFGPETPVLYGSLAPNAVNLCSSFSCSPCLTAYNHRNSPCNGDNQCLKSISPEEVLSKAHEILDNIVDGEA